MDFEQESRDAIENCIALEAGLMDPEVRRNRIALERLLHPECLEFGSSGRTYQRADLIEELATELAVHLPVMEGPRGALLSDSVILITYRSVHLDRTVNRMSLWCRTAQGWQLRFHQGTPEGQTSFGSG